tara:strand:- start:654 stop:977 length:324 start_codon:yes stop_codon:yes gene_type:complete
VSKKDNKKINTDYIEVIRWMDAQSDDGWSDDRTAELANVVTVGFIVAEDKKAVCVASTYAGDDTNSRMHIPKCWIKSRKKINIEELEKDNSPLYPFIETKEENENRN